MSATESDGMVEYAIDDLASWEGIEPEASVVISVEEMTWRDGSLGCPPPGLKYAQALIDGAVIVPEADGVLYHYHTRTGGDPFYCADPASPRVFPPPRTCIVCFSKRLRQW